MRVKWKGKTQYLVLSHQKEYEVLSIEKGWYRIVDDSGEDYLYPPDLFDIVDTSPTQSAQIAKKE